MATYAIGDIQGCYHTLCNLLRQVAFNPHHDRLWLVGDLINRGAGSLEVLRMLVEFHAQHPSAIVAVLGNHDLHALTVASGLKTPHRDDTLQPLLDAPDSGRLLEWLRQRPLLHAESGYFMVHAGLLPQWGADQAKSLASEVEQTLRSPDYKTFLAGMYGNQPDIWDDGLQGIARLRLITNALTRLRVCTPDGRMNLDFKGERQNIPGGLVPWFQAPHRKSRDVTVVCGHWSALGFYRGDNVIALDTGCLWGGSLTAVRLDNGEIFQAPCDMRDTPRRLSNQVQGCGR
jgi:bis(5'-nucleosyl)-tetraphosphatase (symmetrical)